MLVLLMILVALFSAPVSGSDVLDLWNVDSIVDPSWMDVETLWTAEGGIINPLGYEFVPLKTGEIMFSSFGGDSGTLRIQAFFAYPSSGTDLTGLVINHGMIMDGELEMAQTFAAGLNCFALAISAPGHGTSTGGSAYEFSNLVRSYPDPRNNHFYQFAYATMRGITYMETLPVINTDWMGALGFSGGADAAIIASAVDERVSLSFPIIPQTDFACGASAGGWINDVFLETGISPDDSNVIYLQDYISPVNYFPFVHGFTTMICASQDEFEPIGCVANTFPLLDEDRSRLEIVPNFDHHCYFTPYAYTGDFDSWDNTTTFHGRILGISNSVINLLRLGSGVPRMPTVTASSDGDSVEFIADVPAEYWASNDVKLWFSVDSAWIFNSAQMHNTLLAPGTYRVKLPEDRPHSLANIIYFVEARCSPIFWMSSLPYVPERMVYRLRPFPRVFFGLSIDEVFSVPEQFTLSAYPNPFNSAVTITAPENAEIEVFDVNGRRIDVISRSASDEKSPAIQGDFSPSGRNDSRAQFIWRPAPALPSGVYLVRATLESRLSSGAEATATTAAKRVVYLK